MQLSNQPIHHK